MSTDLLMVLQGREVDNILGIAKIPSGTGEAQAKATLQLLNLWEVVEDIVDMCFDITVTNTGDLKGACTIVQSHLDRQLLSFACQHLVHEVIIGGIFTALFGPSTSPNIPIFERFLKYLPNIISRT